LTFGKSLTDEPKVLTEDLILPISLVTVYSTRRTLGCIPSPCSAALKTNNSWNFLGLSLAGGSLESFDELLVIDGPCNTDPVTVRRISGAGPEAAGAICQYHPYLPFYPLLSGYPLWKGWRETYQA
jgi:hypothetical protein